MAVWTLRPERYTRLASRSQQQTAVTRACAKREIRWRVPRCSAWTAELGQVAGLYREVKNVTLR